MGKQALIVSRGSDTPAVLGGIVGGEWILRSASTSQEALQILSGAPTDGPPDLIILDYDLPDLDGLSFLRIARERLGEIPPTVLYVAGPLDDAGQMRAEKFGLLDILVKPVEPVRLERALAPLLWVSSGMGLTVVEFLGMALRRGLSGVYRVESGSMSVDAEVRQGKLLQIRSGLFLARWRASLEGMGIALPPPDPDPAVDLRNLEEAVRYTPELVHAKTQAVLAIFSAFPQAESVSVRKAGEIESRTDLPVPLFGLLTSLVEHCTEEHLAPLRSEDLALLPGPVGLSPEMPLSPHHGYLLSQCVRPVPLRSILRMGVLPEIQLLRAAYLMLVLGLLGSEPEAPEPFSLEAMATKLREEARRMRAQREGIRNLGESLRGAGVSPYDILGVTHGASYETVVRSFEALRSQMGPRSLHPTVLKEMEAEIGWINAKVSEAFLLIQAHWLDDRQKRIQADVKEMEEKQVHRIGVDMTQVQQIGQKRLEEADRLYRRALNLMEEEEFHEASQYVKLALFYNPLSAPYHALQGRLLAMMKATRAKHQAEKSFLRAEELEPFTVDYKLDLARLYLSLDLFTRCRGQLEKIHALDPKNVELPELKRALKEKEKV